MVGDDSRELGVLLGIGGSAAGFEMLLRGAVIAGFKFAEAEEAGDTRGVGRELQNFLEGGESFAELVGVVEDGADVPPAFGPIRTERQSAAVKIDGLGFLAGIAGGRGGVRERIEIGGRLRGGNLRKGNGARRK